MKPNPLANTLVAAGILTLSSIGLAIAAPCRANPCAPHSSTSRMNPCAAHNPCAAKNPCRMKHNPCAMKNPCAAGWIDPKLVTQPSNYRPYKGNHKDLVAYGEELFQDTKLSTNGMSCQSCHQNNSLFKNTFAEPYPHFIQMTHDRSKFKTTELDEMVQFCMVAPMASKPFEWDSKNLAALTAYTATLQKNFKLGQNPCAANPCAAHNPCAAKNPCAMKHNPCTANPCAANPCSAKEKSWWN